MHWLQSRFERMGYWELQLPDELLGKLAQKLKKKWSPDLMKLLLLVLTVHPQIPVAKAQAYPIWLSHDILKSKR